MKRFVVIIVLFLILSVDGYIYFIGNEAYSSYDDLSDCREYFFSEYFDGGNGKFGVLDVSIPAELGHGWIWDSDYREMKGNSYKNGVNYNSESWLYSEEIDLTGRSNATLAFRSVTRYFHDIRTQARLMISSDGGDSWTEGAGMWWIDSVEIYESK